MALAARRRRRRRPWWLLFAALLTVVVLAVNAAVSARSKGPARQLAELAYLDEVRPFVERSTEQGAELDRVRTDAAKLGRVGVARRMERLTTDANNIVREVRAADPPDSLLTAHHLLVAALALRADAAGAVRGALERALGTEPPGPVVEALAGAGADMVAADRAYGRFLADVPKGPGVMPPSQWVADPNRWEQAELSVFVASLRSSSALAPVHDVAVVLFTTEPAAVATENGASVLPAVRSLRLHIVVANAGNETARRVTVTAALEGAGDQVQSVRDFVDLAPGQRQALTLGGLRAGPGGPYTLRVRIGPVEGETEVADNEKTLSIAVR